MATAEGREIMLRSMLQGIGAAHPDDPKSPMLDPEERGVVLGLSAVQLVGGTTSVGKSCIAFRSPSSLFAFRSEVK